MASHRHNRTELSVIPDLRYEYSYLKSIKRYVHLERLDNDASPSSRPWNQSSEEKLLEDYENLEPRDPTSSPEKQSPAQPTPRLGEVVHIQWKNVLWYTTRDQIMAPFLQGALWGIASYFLTPISRDLGSKLSHFMPNKEGKISEWFREWGKDLIGSQSKSTKERPHW